MRRFFLHLLILFVVIFCSVANTTAGEVEIVNVEFVHKHNVSWRVNVTLKHNDTGWNHYADAWQVISETGMQLGERILFHPHENEQPFTRSLSQLVIPKGTHIVYVEAHDKKHGWSKQRVKVDLNSTKGKNYNVRR